MRSAGLPWTVFTSAPRFSIGPSCFFRNVCKSRIVTVKTSWPACMARRCPSRSRTLFKQQCAALFTLDHQDAAVVFHFCQKGLSSLQRAGDFHHVHGSTTSVLPFFYPVEQCRRGASLPFWVKFVCTAGVASSCDMVGHVHRDVFCSLLPWFCRLFLPSRTCSSPVSFDPNPGYQGVLIIRASIALGPSEGASLMHTHSCKYAFFKVSWLGIHNERLETLCGLSLCLMLSSAWFQKCWCGTIAARFSQVAQRHSHDLCRFSLLNTGCVARPSRMLARNWKHRWLLQCPAKLLGTIRIVGVVHPIKSNQNLRVFCEAFDSHKTAYGRIIADSS